MAKKFIDYDNLPEETIFVQSTKKVLVQTLLYMPFLMAFGIVLFFYENLFLSDVNPNNIDYEKVRRVLLFLRFLGVFIFGLGVWGLWSSVKSLFDNQRAIIINRQGFSHNFTVKYRTVFIPWEDVEALKPQKGRRRLIYGWRRRNIGLKVLLSNPEDYLRGGTRSENFGSRIGVLVVGTPVLLSSSFMDVKLDTMIDTLNAYWLECKKLNTLSTGE